MNNNFLELVECVGVEAAYKLAENNSGVSVYFCESKRTEIACVIGDKLASIAIERLRGQSVYFSMQKEKRLAREELCLTMHRQGMNAGEIAKRLGVAQVTVYNHLKKGVGNV